jgi:hypothetical protein
MTIIITQQQTMTVIIREQQAMNVIRQQQLVPSSSSRKQ